MKCLFFCLFPVVLFAQPLPPSAFKTGISLTGYNRESVQTPTILFAFQKDFFPRTAIEVSAEWALPQAYKLETESGNLQSFRFSLSLAYKVLEERNQLFNLGIGISAGLYDQDYLEIFGSGTIQTAMINVKPGGLILAEYHYVLPNDLFIGGRASAFRYDTNQGGWSLGLVGGMRF